MTDEEAKAVARERAYTARLLTRTEMRRLYARLADVLGNDKAILAMRIIASEDAAILKEVTAPAPRFPFARSPEEKQ